MSVILRYVSDFKVTERCVRLVRVFNMKRKSLADVIVEVLSNLNLPIKDVIGMGFDGAANMSGKDEGVQQHLKLAGPEFAEYVHCFAVGLSK